MTKLNTRNTLLGLTKQFREETFEFEVDADTKIKVLVRQPTVKDRAELSKKSVNTDPDTKEMTFDALSFQVHGLIKCAFDFETKEPLFTEADFDSIVSFPTGSWVDDLGNKVSEVLNVSVESKKKN